MAKSLVKKGATSRIEYVWISDSTSTAGAGKTGLAFGTASLTAYYVRAGATTTAITLVTQTVSGAYSSGGFVEVDSANMPGLYRLDVPNAAFATGVNRVIVLLKGATGMAPVVLEYQLVDFDPEAAADLGLTNLDATVSSRLSTAGYTAPLTAATTRSAIGLASANLDTQLATLLPTASYTAPLTAATTRSAIGLASANLDTQLAAIPTATANADALLDRNMATGTDSGSPTVRTPRQALRFLRNKWSLSGTALTVTKEDDTTASWTGVVTATPGADPITGSDPA